MTTPTLPTTEMSELVTRTLAGTSGDPAALARLAGELGSREELWASRVQFAEGRWYERLHLDDDVEVWLISWQRDTSTTLHDHGGSAGAFTVLVGTLHEDRPEGGQLLRRAVSASSGPVGFDHTYVHDVANRTEAPAISLHVYFPPLSAMTYYAMDEAGPRAVRTEPVLPGEPESEVPASIADEVTRDHAPVVWA